ncbi:MAG TPA: hypothetical protein DDW42_09270 [Desulfobacteraceae bacterium]|nr:hypothetical protein [Desulfobacteraceae bacterium]
MIASGIITLTTDFGLKDAYVAIMKGVILSINPEARIIDISHQVNAGSIVNAASLVEETYRFFPEGAIHVAVVDPGVGGRRRPILFQTENHFFVGPDNGIFWPIISNLQDVEIINLTEMKYFLPHVSHTFHGRDIFAPVAAHLSRGVDPHEFGPVNGNIVHLDFPVPQQEGNILSGQVMRVDHFGNIITNIHKNDLERFSVPEEIVISVESMTVKGIYKTYSEVKGGDTLALIGSSGYLEIAVNSGRACDLLKLETEFITGSKVEVS